MLAAFVADLRSTPIVTNQNVMVIKNYISDNYPGLSFDKSTLMLADAVRQIVDQKIRAISEKYRAAIRENLFRNMAHRKSFQINAADVLEASLPLSRGREDMAAEICHWIHQTVKKMVPLDRLGSFYHQLSERYSKDGDLNLEALAVRIDQAGLLKERAAASREERLNRRRIARTRLETKADELLVGSGIDHDGVAESQPTPPGLVGPVPKPVAAPLPKRTGYLSRRVAVYMSAGAMVILALFMVNLVRESIKDTAVLASPKNSRPVVRVTDTDTSVNKISNTIGTVKDTTSLQPIQATNAMKSDDIGRNFEFWADATAYDLSFESCGKTREHPLYGITRSGVKASAGRTIAVDPDVIPLGSKVYITFPENYNYLDGIYVAEDTGRLIKGRRIDIFLGEDLPDRRSVYQDAMKFGVQKVKLEILGNQL